MQTSKIKPTPAPTTTSAGSTTTQSPAVVIQRDAQQVASVFSRKGQAQTAINNARRHATAYLDSEYTHDAAERERIFGMLLNERDQILRLGPKYRQMVRDEPVLMELLERAAAKHDQALDRGEAQPFTRKGLT